MSSERSSGLAAVHEPKRLSTFPVHPSEAACPHLIFLLVQQIVVPMDGNPVYRCAAASSQILARHERQDVLGSELAMVGAMQFGSAELPLPGVEVVPEVIVADWETLASVFEKRQALVREVVTPHKLQNISPAPNRQ